MTVFTFAPSGAAILFAYIKLVKKPTAPPLTADIAIVTLCVNSINNPTTAVIATCIIITQRTAL
jgi:hypothetical protein